MTTRPGSYSFTIYQGATFSRVLTWKDEAGTLINLTGFTARMHIRTSKDAAAPFVTLTTENGGITLGGALGTITLAIAAAATAILSEESGVYDLELVSGTGVVTRLLEGAVTVSKEVTR